MSDFGQRLKTIRKKRNITQKELAESLQLAQSSVANYENNTRFPSETPLRQISEYLNVSIDYLLGISEYEDSEVLAVHTASPNGGVGIEYDKLWKEVFELLVKGDEAIATQKILNAYQKSSDPIAIIEKVYIPILRETGRRWEREELSIAQEHFISNLIDRWLIMTSVPRVKTQKKFAALFVVPSSEEHTIILKMIREYFKMAGWLTYYIGNSVPISSLRQFTSDIKIDLIVTAVSLKDNLNSAEHLIQSLRATPQGKKVKILAGGRGIKDQKEATDFLGADFYIAEIDELQDAIVTFEQEIDRR